MDVCSGCETLSCKQPAITSIPSAFSVMKASSYWKLLLACWRVTRPHSAAKCLEATNFLQRLINSSFAFFRILSREHIICDEATSSGTGTYVSFRRTHHCTYGFGVNVADTSGEPCEETLWFLMLIMLRRLARLNCDAWVRRQSCTNYSTSANFVTSTDNVDELTTRRQNPFEAKI